MLATLCSYEGLFGPHHPQTLVLTTVLGEALCASGDRALGKRLLERAVLDLTKHHGRHHVVRLRALRAWSIVLRQDGDWSAALPVQRELLDCQTHLLGPDHPEAIACRNDLSASVAAVMEHAALISA